MSANYGSVSVTNNAASEPEESLSSSKSSSFAKIAGVFFAAVLIVSKISGGNQADVTVSMAGEKWFLDDMKSDMFSSGRGDMWPEAVITGPNAYNHPTTTAEAAGLGWTKVADEPCNPQLGEPYRKNGGARSKTDPVTLYFTPDAAGVPGIVSAIEVDYYGYIEEDLIGDYFRDGQVTSDGQIFHSLALALRDYDEYNLCDTSRPIPSTELEKLTIAPAGAAENIPLAETDEELQTGWEQGSCMKTMGVHWAKDVVGGSHMTYETKNLVPIVAMYHPGGSVQAVFFAATDYKQTYPDPVACPVDMFNMANTAECAAGKTNMWDLSTGLLQANTPPFLMCSNFCRADCAFTGSPDGIFTTMHFMFKNITLQAGEDFETCEGPDFVVLNPVTSCRKEAGPGVQFAPPPAPAPSTYTYKISVTHNTGYIGYTWDADVVLYSGDGEVLDSSNMARSDLFAWREIVRKDGSDFAEGDENEKTFSTASPVATIMDIPENVL
jgi:hypothetical protein